jgi:cytochrome bd ubiquinol oxidase subunit II
METLWFAIIACMLATYVVLDGFDLGAGVLHQIVAKNDGERRTVLSAIGPLWDGNEVWLIASGGVLVFAFPKAYSAGFSGFYLPLMMVLWLLILRGLSIEFRSHLEHGLWRSFWDGLFTFSSTLLAIILGAALGNIIRGVPLEASGFFAGPLFTDFSPRGRTGVLDWYTVTIGVFTLLTLSGHGALYLVWKTEGEVRDRARALARPIWAGVGLVGVLATIATAKVQPDLYPTLAARPFTWPLVIAMVGGYAAIWIFLSRRKELPAFLGSVVFIASMLAATAAGLYPTILRSTVDSTADLTVFNATAGGHGMRVGLLWWTPAILLAIGYFTYLFWSFRGKVKPSEHGHGY